MIPEERLSTTLVYDNLLLPNPQPSELVSRELGGVALNDPSQGLAVKVWTCTTVVSANPLVPDQIVVFADDVPQASLFSAFGVSEVSLAFDQNMRPFVAFVTQGNAKFYWYDSLLEEAVISDLPSGSTSPRCTLDDHRARQTGNSDIIMVYIHDGNFCFRAERDRYEIEYVLIEDVNLQIISPTIQWVAFNLNYRLQFSLRGNFN